MLIVLIDDYLFFFELSGRFFCYDVFDFLVIIVLKFYNWLFIDYFIIKVLLKYEFEYFLYEIK